jgi:hypothetical protein
MNQPVRGYHPLFRRQESHEVFFHLLRCPCPREAQALGEPQDVRVHDDSGRLSESGAQHHVGGLARDPRKGQQLGHGIRHAASEVVGQPLAGALDGLRLVAEETRALDQLFDLGSIGAGVVQG